jgi:hypothetical protein
MMLPNGFAECDESIYGLIIGCPINGLLMSSFIIIFAVIFFDSPSNMTKVIFSFLIICVYIISIIGIGIIFDIIVPDFWTINQIFGSWEYFVNNLGKGFYVMLPLTLVFIIVGMIVNYFSNKIEII